ncbi:hypothetical protein FEA48_19585 [Pseudomonas nitroreducens]|uniref:Uncharacterized protein n=1 Tax=Pseudomonas nitroreducens TaxID=46680 RepID=A0A5R9A328_PSENT|nr:hypothetical protein [Pseudomonas nitroreducens]TLP72475.1 hypothetical protein FEA48_19585 [Pseudomonas nitroreducens]
MEIESQVGALPMEQLSGNADIKALNIIISGLVAQIVEGQGHSNLDIAELHALRKLSKADTTAGTAPNPMLIARFFANARDKSD